MKNRIIIVGGGTGGTILANLLARKLSHEIIANQVELLLLSDSPTHYYKPAFMYVAFNRFFKEELERPQQSLLRPEIQFILDKAESFDLERREIRAKSGQKYHYDYLIFATGCLPTPERIEGLKEAGDHFYLYQPAHQLADKITTIEKGKILITVSFPKTPNVPHQCGIAPMETTLMLDDLLKKRGVRNNVEILYTYPTQAQMLKDGLFMQKPVSDALPSIFESRGIKFERDFTLSRVDPDNKIAYSEEGVEHEFDILMATPPITAVEAVINTGLGDKNIGEGWLPTNHETLQVIGQEGVYVIGDTVDLPVSKAGGTCHSQAGVIADNITAEIRLGYPIRHYDGRVQAIAQMGLDAGMPLVYNYKNDVIPTPMTKLGGMLRNGFNRGLYWATVRGLV